MPRLLPEGILDHDSKKVLVEAQKHTPPFLFRGWKNTPPPSGGFLNLNTVDAITPRAFMNRPESTKPRTIYDMSCKKLSTMCNLHLTAATRFGRFHTEFSSWAASLEVALDFVRDREHEAYISIIDTRELSRKPSKNVIVHVPLLAPLGVMSYPEEYLAHGVIRSSTAHKAIPAFAFFSVSFQYPIASYMNMAGSHPAEPLSDQEIERAVKVAKQFRLGEEGSPNHHKFGTVVMLAILCSKRRDGRLWKGEDEACSVASRLNRYIVREGFVVSEEWYSGLIAENVYVEDFDDVKQLIHMMQAIANWRYGRASRRRAPEQL